MNKEEMIKFRCSFLEREIIERKASNAGMSVSALCRASVLNQKIGCKLTGEELETCRMLQKYHNNFVAISNLLKKKDSSFAKEVSATAREIRDFLKKFK